MNLSKLTNENLIMIDAVFENRIDAIRQMTQKLADEGKLLDQDAFFNAVMQRENEGPTCLGEGLAVPHGKSAAVKAPVFAAAFIKKGDLQWQGLDGDESVEMVFLLAIPPADAGSTHIAILTELSSTLVDEDFRTLLKAAQSPEMVLKLLSGDCNPAEFVEPASVAVEQPQVVAENEEMGTNKAYGTVLLTGCAIVGFLFTLM